MSTKETALAATPTPSSQTSQTEPTRNGVGVNGRAELIFKWKTGSEKLSWREYCLANGIPVEDASYRDNPALLPSRQYPLLLSSWWKSRSCQDAYAREENGSKRGRVVPKSRGASKAAIAAARDHCANYQSDGTCLGVDLDFKRFRKEGSPCALRKCEACLYFEECVLPQVLPSVTEEYRKSLPAFVATSVRPQHAIRTCPEWRKRELKPRQRWCEECLRSRKRALKGAWSAKVMCLDCRHVEVKPPQKRCAGCASKRVLIQNRHGVPPEDLEYKGGRGRKLLVEDPLVTKNENTRAGAVLAEELT